MTLAGSHLTRCGIILAAALISAAPVHAQGSGDGFLFRVPSGAVAIRGGFDRAIAGSDIFTFVTNELTLRRRDFSSPNLVIDVDVSVTPRVKAVFSWAYSSSTSPSEFRHFVDNNDQPIQQSTTLRRIPLTASVKMYLVNPGRVVGQFAWIPARFAPYVGAGGGVMWYRFGQDGDFIDLATLRVFSDQFDSHGWSAMAQAFVGSDVSINPRFALTGEARYAWARSRLGSDFSEFDRIDLSGISLTGGIAIRY